MSKTLLDYFKEKGAKYNKKYQCWELKISDCKGDRFNSWLEIVPDVVSNKIHVFRQMLGPGPESITYDEVVNNHNDLHSTFKNDYLLFLEELKKNNIYFELWECRK